MHFLWLNVQLQLFHILTWSWVSSSCLWLRTFWRHKWCHQIGVIFVTFRVDCWTVPWCVWFIVGIMLTVTSVWIFIIQGFFIRYAVDWLIVSLVISSVCVTSWLLSSSLPSGNSIVSSFIQIFSIIRAHLSQ